MFCTGHCSTFPATPCINVNLCPAWLLRRACSGACILVPIQKCREVHTGTQKKDESASVTLPFFRFFCSQDRCNSSDLKTDLKTDIKTDLKTDAILLISRQMQQCTKDRQWGRLCSLPSFVTHWHWLKKAARTRKGQLHYHIQNPSHCRQFIRLYQAPGVQCGPVLIHMTVDPHEQCRVVHTRILGMHHPWIRLERHVMMNLGTQV